MRHVLDGYRVLDFTQVLAGAISATRQRGSAHSRPRECSCGATADETMNLGNAYAAARSFFLRRKRAVKSAIRSGASNIG